MFTYNNQTSVSTRELAWGQLGENLSDEPMTAEQALTRGGLAGWNVRSVPLTTALGDHGGAMEDAGLVVPEKFATVATVEGQAKVLGVVGNRYTIYQNEATIELLDTIIDESGAHFVAAGSLRDHRKTFAVLKLPTSIQVGGQDATDLYLGVTNSHDGTGSLLAWTTGVRLACTNMLNSSIRGAKSSWRLRHTANISGKVAEARESLNLTWEWAQEFELVANDWLSTKLSEADFDRLLDRLEPASDSAQQGTVARQAERRATIQYLYHEAATNELGRGTKWGAYNAFTEYADWFYPVKGDEAARATRALDGQTIPNYKQAAFDALVAV